MAEYRISYYLKDIGLYTASVKVRGQHIHQSPFSFNFPRPRVIGSLGHGLLSKPWGVCINEENTQLIIGDRNNHCVQVTLLQLHSTQDYESFEREQNIRIYLKLK